MDTLDISYTEESSILGEGDMSFHVIIEEGPSEEVSAHIDGIENVNSGSNVYENLGTATCSFFEESVPGPSSVQELSEAVTATTIQSNADYNNNTKQDKKIRCCSKCNYKTIDTGNLSRHKKVHQDERRKHECDTCGQSYSALYDLKEHVRTVHGNDKLLCESCPFSCNTRTALFRHKSMKHSVNSKSYTCLYCNKKFLEKEHYHGHINGHIGIRPYGCPTCKNSFKYKHHLTRHMLVCSGNYGEKFKCNICNICLKSSSSLKDHKDGKHGQKTKVCPCGKRFSWRVSYIRHSKTCQLSK